MTDKPSTDWMNAAPRTPVDLKPDVPHSARMYDAYLGGKTNYRADREAVEKIVDFWPGVRIAARENRAFMHRVTRVLARDHGIRQWLDIGTGIPTQPNLHEVAQSEIPDARVVYVDYDPIVLAHARALFTDTPQGATAYVQSDVREPLAILASEDLRDTLDLTRPVALSLNALMHFITDEDDPYGIVRTLMDALPSGSALALSHCTPDLAPETWAKVHDTLTGVGTSVRFRTKDEVARFFDGLDLIEPGVTICHRWRPDADRLHCVDDEHRDINDAIISIWAGVAIKP